MRDHTLDRTVSSTQTGKPFDEVERVSNNMKGEALGGREEEQKGFNGEVDGSDSSSTIPHLASYDNVSTNSNDDLINFLDFESSPPPESGDRKSTRLNSSHWE